ncbi:hypothetical protein BDR26DRAFT_916754 [Obelidium mucronatum]|nr:hypothetical protein BDR26DRAFT_916754 [Obelidium mucronatum]
MSTPEKGKYKRPNLIHQVKKKTQEQQQQQHEKIIKECSSMLWTLTLTAQIEFKEENGHLNPPSIPASSSPTNECLKFEPIETQEAIDSEHDEDDDASDNASDIYSEDSHDNAIDLETPSEALKSFLVKQLAAIAENTTCEVINNELIDDHMYDIIGKATEDVIGHLIDSSLGGPVLPVVIRTLAQDLTLLVSRAQIALTIHLESNPVAQPPAPGVVAAPPLPPRAGPIALNPLPVACPPVAHVLRDHVVSVSHSQMRQINHSEASEKLCERFRDNDPRINASYRLACGQFPQKIWPLNAAFLSTGKWKQQTFMRHQRAEAMLINWNMRRTTKHDFVVNTQRQIQPRDLQQRRRFCHAAGIGPFPGTPVIFAYGDGKLGSSTSMGTCTQCVVSRNQEGRGEYWSTCWLGPLPSHCQPRHRPSQLSCDDYDRPGYARLQSKNLWIQRLSRRSNINAAKNTLQSLRLSPNKHPLSFLQSIQTQVLILANLGYHDSNNPALCAEFEANNIENLLTDNELARSMKALIFSKAKKVPMDFMEVLAIVSNYELGSRGQIVHKELFGSGVSKSFVALQTPRWKLTSI